MFSSVVRIWGLCLFPSGGMTYNLFCLYLSFTKELFSLHLGHHTARLVMTQKMLSEKKSTEKKSFPSLINKSPPSKRHSSWTITILNYDLQTDKFKITIYRIFEAYLNILFCSWTTEKYFSYAKKNLLTHNWK